MRKFSKTAMIFVVLTMLSLLLVSCKKKVEITIDEKMTIGQTYELKANQDVTWTSSNSKILKIEGSTATPLAKGEVIVTATAGKKTAEQKVTVIEGAKVDPLVMTIEPSMEEGKEYSITCNKQATFTSSNVAAAKIENGKVVAVAEGVAEITATFGNEIVKVTVTVTKAAGSDLPKDFSISVNTVMAVGSEYTLGCSEAGTVVWSSSDPTILSVEGRIATPVKAGKVVVTATIGEKQSAQEVTVILPSEIILDVNNRMLIGATYTLKANQPVVWSSSDLSVLTIDGNAATPIAAGTVTIKATVGDKEATIEVTVTKPSTVPYTPKWSLNAIGFNGNGMTIGILVSPVAEYDPFNADFTATGNGKTIKQKHKRLVEQAYSVSIKYYEWADKASWGPNRVAYINENYLTGDLVSKDNGYILQIATSWIPTLVKSKSVAELYSIAEDNGYFVNAEAVRDGEANYVQSDSYNYATSVNSKVYGYAYGTARPDHFLYYNYDLLSGIGMEDPAELWFKGEWTISNFEQWVKTAQTNLTSANSDNFVLDVGYPEFVIGLVASTGSKLVQLDPANILFTRSSVTSIFDKVQSYYSAGYYNKNHGGNDVTAEFKAGKTIFSSGDIWFLKNSDRFDPGVIEFKIGCVPYPTADGQGGTPITTLDAEEAIKKINGDPLTDASGRYISGVDLSASSFQVPFTESSCYAITSVENGQNGLNSEVIFRIYHDLTAGEGADPDALVTLTPDESYRNTLSLKLDYPISVDVIMSTEDNMYFEMLPTVSMTVGSGSHWSGNAFWPLVIGICSKPSVTAATRLTEVLEEYKAALRQIGYVVR